MTPEQQQAKAEVTPLGKLQPNPKGGLKDQFHEVCRFKYFSQRTEDSYWQWVVRFLKFHRRQARTVGVGGDGEIREALI